MTFANVSYDINRVSKAHKSNHQQLILLDAPHLLQRMSLRNALIVSLIEDTA